MNLQSLPIFSEREGWLVTADVLVANLDEHLPTYRYQSVPDGFMRDGVQFDTPFVKGSPLQIQNGISSSESSLPSVGPPAAGAMISETSSTSLVAARSAEDACVLEALWSSSETVPTNACRCSAAHGYITDM